MDQPKFKYSWEEAIELLRKDPEHQDLIFHSYLTADLSENSRRFSQSSEFAATLDLLKKYMPTAKKVLDMPGGNGIATYSFAKAGFQVTTVEPNSSLSVGRGAIAKILQEGGLHANIVEAFGEKLPFPSNSFDVVYVRQGLHHAANLPLMLKEIARVLCPGGVLLACREHVVDNYEDSLESFLETQVDHQLYGGEHAFTLDDYQKAIQSAGLTRLLNMGPFDSIINIYPETPESIRKRVLQSKPGKLLGLFLPPSTVESIGLWMMKRKKYPGRLYSFLAKKEGSPHA